MKKVGLLICSTMTRDLNCSSYGCFMTVKHGQGECARYRDEGGAELIGIVSCAGCPTVLAPERILKKARALKETGADVIHMGTCMQAMCPFIAKYKQIIEKEYPDLQVVIGTHVIDTPEMGEMIRCAIRDMILQPQKDMTDIHISMKEMPQAGV